MNGTDVALDTTQAIAVLNAAGDVPRWVQQFSNVYLPVPVVGELRFGALNSRRPAENLKRVETLLSRCKVLEATLRTAEIYANIRLELKRKGKPIPENDIWIAALCVEADVPLATSDIHFGNVDALMTIPR